MKKKLIAILLVMSIMLQGNVIWAVENSDVLEYTDLLDDEETQGQSKGQPIDEMSLSKKIDELTPKSASSAKIISGNTFKFVIDAKTYYKNENKYTAATAPINIDGKNYLPLRVVVDNILEGKMTYEQDSGVVVIVKDNLSLKMTIGNKGAYLNGQYIVLEESVMIKDGTAYIPVKVLSQYFKHTITYNNNTKQITVIGPDQGINKAPIAEFKFGQVTYTEGQNISSTSISYDPDGHQLKDKLWCLIDGQEVTVSKELSHILKKPKAGVYRVGLMVQDQYGLWSEWTYKEMTIFPNQVPEITYLGTEKNTYAQGEAITYQFFYNNESWETITNEKWMYRHADEDVSKAILGKPDALFTEGAYVVTLQIDDAFGNRSEACETTIYISEEVEYKELEFRFNYGKIGDIIDNYQGFNYREYDDAMLISKSLVPGRMIMSDSPEEVTREGILYRDTMNGEGRLLIHHINQFSDTSVAGGTKRLVVVAENKTDEAITVTLDNKTIKGPNTDILYLGQKLLYDYLVGGEEETIVLQPGEKQYIYDSTTKWKQGTCISGLMDVQTNGDVTFTIAAVSSGSTLQSMSGMELFLQVIHPRGTFEGIGIDYSLILDGTKPTKLVLGNGDEEWIKGYDALMQGEVCNKGNYGVSYYLTITATEDVGVILNPRANVFRGAIKWSDEGVYNVPNVGAIFSNTAKAVSLGTIKAGETKTLEYMLPNGSSAPVVIVFIPKSYWND